MYLKNKFLINFLFVFIIKIIVNPGFSKEMNAQELYLSCNDYYSWVNKRYSVPVDEKILFNMGKCQGIIETLGKTMLTLCYERKRNANINKSLTANLEGVKTIDIVSKFLKIASNKGKLRAHSSHSYLLALMSTEWPCNL